MTDLDAIIARMNEIEARQDALFAQIIDQFEKLTRAAETADRFVEAAKGLDL
jgi:hypothetical protein